jgi:DnaJ-domain-containing protein 1
MNNNSRTVQKTATMVEIALVDGEVLQGKLFVSPQGRLTDVLNDDRAFLPLETLDGAFLAIAKATIKRVSLPMPSAQVVGPYRGGDPYKFLGVSENVGRDELKTAYHQLCRTNHPDHVRGLGLGPEFLEVAAKTMSRINVAYSEILKKIGS